VGGASRGELRGPGPVGDGPVEAVIQAGIARRGCRLHLGRATGDRGAVQVGVGVAVDDVPGDESAVLRVAVLDAEHQVVDLPEPDVDRRVVESRLDLRLVGRLWQIDGDAQPAQATVGPAPDTGPGFTAVEAHVDLAG